jgi:hypothetical protein
MFFLPRVSGLIVLAGLAGLLVALAAGFEEIILPFGAVAFVVLLLGVVFDLYEGPDK